jgi:hypothetical protein
MPVFVAPHVVVVLLAIGGHEYLHGTPDHPAAV